jgi:uncharacterized cupin superfamily protein
MMKSMMLALLLLNVVSLKAQQGSGVFRSDFGNIQFMNNGLKVTGTYPHAEGRIEGEFEGKILTGIWTQSNGKGRFIFQFNSDYTSFSGKWSYNDAEPDRQWNGSFMSGNFPLFPKTQTSARADIAGRYATDFNEMNLARFGNRVTGTYAYAGGRIEGELIGTVLSGWWYQSNGKGRFIFEFADDFSSFKGKWGRDNAEPSGAWNGKRLQ